jgi:pullulanase/glycogen debranching enzyme
MDPHRKSADSYNAAAEGTSASLAYPLGPTLTAAGVNFSIFSAHATQVEILFFDHADAIALLITGTSLYPESWLGNSTDTASMVQAKHPTETGLTASRFWLIHMAKAFP